MQDGVQCIESITLTKKCGATGMQIHAFRARRIDSEKENRTRVKTGAADLRLSGA
jgi:hypothetical protein